MLRTIEPALVVLGLLAVLELLTRRDIIAGRVLPPPTRIFGAFIDDIQRSALWDAVGQSMGAWALGMLIVVVIAIPVGSAIGLSTVTYHASHLTLEFLRTIPSIGAIPILIFLYGIGFKLTVVLVILTAVWPLLIQTVYGIHDVDSVAVDTARLYGLGRLRRFTGVVLPSASSSIATGIRVSGTIALVIAIAASLIAGGGGLGQLIAGAEQSARPDLLYARVLMSGLLGLAVTSLLYAIENRVMHWHPSRRGQNR